MSGRVARHAADSEAAINHQLTITNKQVMPVPVCVASPQRTRTGELIYKLTR